MNKGKKVLGIVVLLLLVATITIGYSYLSATLNISGTSKIKVADWDVHFANVDVTAGSVVAEEPEIDATDALTVTYSVELSNPGDFYEFTIDVENNGSVDAVLTALPTITGPDAAQQVYTTYSFTHEDGTAITNLDDEDLAVNAVKTYKVRVEFIKDIDNDDLPSTAQDIDLTVSMNYQQA